MAKDYTLTGIATSVELGSGGPLIKDNSGAIEMRDTLDSTFIITRGADAVASNDYVTLAQLQSSQSGLYWKDPALAATTGALPANTYAGGPETLTADGNGALPTQDGVSLSVSDRLLVKDEATGANKGIYDVTDLGSAGTPWVLTRSSDMASGSDATNIALFISEGSVNADTAWTQTADSAITATTALTFIQFASVASGVTSIGSVGTGVILVASGAAPIPTIRTITSGSVVTATLNVDNIDLDVAGLSIDTARLGTDSVTTSKIVDLNVTTAKLADGAVTTIKLGDDAVTEVKMAPLAAVHYRYLSLNQALFNASPNNIGLVLPSTALIIGAEVLVGTVAGASTDLELGTGGDPNAVMATSENNTNRADTYKSSNMVTGLGGSQLIATTTGTGAVGTAIEISVRFERTA